MITRTDPRDQEEQPRYVSAVFLETSSEAILLKLQTSIFNAGFLEMSSAVQTKTTCENTNIYGNGQRKEQKNSPKPLSLFLQMIHGFGE